MCVISVILAQEIIATPARFSKFIFRIFGGIIRKLNRLLGKVGGICADDDLRHFNFDYAAYIMYQREPHLALFSLIWHRYGAGLWHGHSSRVLLAMVDLRTLILTCCVLFEFFVTHK